MSHRFASQETSACHSLPMIFSTSSVIGFPNHELSNMLFTSYNLPLLKNIFLDLLGKVFLLHVVGYCCIVTFQH